MDKYMWTEIHATRTFKLKFQNDYISVIADIYPHKYNSYY